MNKLVFATLLTLFAMGTAQAELCQVIFEKVSSGGNRLWNDSETMGCFDVGGTCKRTDIYCDPAVTTVVPASGGGYTLSGKITGIDYVSVGISPPDSFSTGGSNVSFLSGEYQIRISGCTQYSFLNGVTVSANSITTNGSGLFTVFVPVYQ